MAAAKQMEIIEIDDFSPSPNDKSTPLRPVFCLRNKAQMRTIEEKEECFILEFDPDDDDLDITSLCFSNDSAKSEVDLRVVAEKGQIPVEKYMYPYINSRSKSVAMQQLDNCSDEVACRDYPHPRNTCAKFPFGTTPHDRHCKMCYCYVCDLAAPCIKWNGTSGHCHAFNNEAWNTERRVKRQSMKTK